MPLLAYRQPFPELHIGLWLITETEEALFELAGEKQGEDLLIQSSGNRLKVQRLAVRILLQNLCGRSDLSYKASGKPFLEGSPMHISVSHTNEMAAVITNSKEGTGIDIEMIKPRIALLATKFMSDNELECVENNDKVDLLHIYWCAKEALYKLYGNKELFFIEHIRIDPFRYSGTKGVFTGSIETKDMNRKFHLCYEKVNGHMLVYVVNS